MADKTSAPTRTSTRLTFSCIRCAERKVKCDRQRPCSACTKHNADCLFNTSKPPRKKNQRVKVKVLADRLSQYEALLQKHGIDRSELTDIVNRKQSNKHSHTDATDPREVQLQTPLSTELDADRYSDTPHHKNDQAHSKFVENTLWKRVIEESHDSDYILNHSDTSSDFGSSDDGHGFVLSIRTRTTKRPRLPPFQTMVQLLDDFVENVDPLTKLVHVPTLRPAFQKAASDIKTIPRGFEALMFAIFGAAVMSLKDDDCQVRFNEPRRSVLSKYACATEAALSRARFMATTSLVVLQALVLHLYSVRDIYEPRALWTLTGVAVRIAQGMGLDRDGSVLGLSPFETEIRRRVWWQLKSHDFRTAELCGLAKFRDIDTSADSTHWPTNINDEDLHPGMSSVVAETNKLTDSVFVVFKFEMTSFAASRIAMFRKQGKDPSQWNLDTPDSDRTELKSAVEELEATLEMKYLRYCDPSQPLHLALLLVGRYGMNVVTFLTHHPRRWATMEYVSLSERKLVWDGSIKLLEQYSMLQSNPLLKRFAWHAPYFQQWHAFIHVLDVLRAEPLKTDAPKAWQLVSSIYDHTAEMLLDLKKPIHVAVGSLCLKAYSAREAALLHANAHLPPTPNFIAQLRQRREVAMGKRQARKAKLNRPTELSVRELHPHHAHSVGHKSDTLVDVLPQQDSVARSLLSPQLYEAIEANPFYLLDESDLDQVNNLEMDMDFMLSEDYSIDDVTLEPINWEQWDTWLADSNIMRSSLT